MKNLLLTFLFLGLVVVLKAQEASPHNKKDYSGIWYPKALIYSERLPSDAIPSKAFPVTITTDEDDLEVEVLLMEDGDCHLFTIMMEKTDEPDQYIAFEGRRFVYILEIPVEDHYILYCEDSGHGNSFVMAQLMGRNPDENPEAVKEFKKFVRSKNLKEKNIFIPDLQEECVPEDH